MHTHVFARLLLQLGVCLAVFLIIRWVRLPPCSHVFFVICAAFEIIRIPITPFAKRNYAGFSAALFFVTNCLAWMPFIRDERLLTNFAFFVCFHICALPAINVLSYNRTPCLIQGQFPQGRHIHFARGRLHWIYAGRDRIEHTARCSAPSENSPEKSSTHILRRKHTARSNALIAAMKSY